MPKHHGMDDIPEKTLNFWIKIRKDKNYKIELTSPKCPKARTWLIVNMISDKIKFGEDKSIIGKPRNKPRYTTLEKRPTAISLKGKPSTINNPTNINDVVTIIHQIILSVTAVNSSMISAT